MLNSSTCRPLSSRLSMFPALILLLASVAYARSFSAYVHFNYHPIPTMYDEQRITEKDVLVGVFAMLTGFLYCFFGSSMWRFTVFVAGFYAFGAFSATVTLNILQNDEYLYRSEEECITIILIVFAIAGLIGGLLATCFYKLGVMFVGAVGGFFFALWLLSFSPTGIFATGFARILFISIFGAAGALLTLRIEKHAVIIGSSVAGAFVFILGVDCFVHSGFRAAVKEIISAIKRRQRPYRFEYTYDKQDAVYILLGSAALMAIAGAVIQYKRYSGLRLKNWE